MDTNDTPGNSPSPKARRPSGVFKSSRTGMADSPASAKPPVPDKRAVLSTVASSRLASTAMIRNAPQASRATVATLRERLRAHPRNASEASVRFDPLASAERSQTETPEIPAINKSVPPPKNASAAARPPVQAAQASVAAAPSALPSDSQPAQWRCPGLGGGSLPGLSSSRAGREARLRIVNQITMPLMNNVAAHPPASVAAAQWNRSSEVPAAARQIVFRAQTISRA